MSSYSCSKCDYVTKNKNHIKTHLKSIKCGDANIVETKQTIECDICGKEFETEPYLKSHKKTCIEKRTNTVISYANSDDINNEIKELKNLVKALSISLQECMNENCGLKKRVEKLEQKDTLEKKKSRDGFEPVPDGCSSKCLHREIIEDSIKDKEQMLKVFDIENEASLSMGVIVDVIENGEKKAAKLFHTRIDILNSDDSYYFQPEGKKKNVNKLKIIIKRIKCKNVATLEKMTEDESIIFSCEEHREVLAKKSK